MPVRTFGTPARSSRRSDDDDDDDDEEEDEDEDEDEKGETGNCRSFFLRNTHEYSVSICNCIEYNRIEMHRYGNPQDIFLKFRGPMAPMCTNTVNIRQRCLKPLTWPSITPM